MISDAVAYLPSPLGLLALHGSDAGLSSVQFVAEASAQPGLAVTPAAAVAGCLREAYQQLAAYFGRELQEFDLAVDVRVGTPFQRQVWASLPAVGYGRTASYLDMARQLGNPGAVRAVGAANGQNPLALIWPCHRIIGASGKLTGYAGGLSRKQWLLDFERPALQGRLF
ncbi:methylated-DNA--[protein]-cysteine S-methyltransferase [Hymenobacter tenuis]